MQPLPGDAGLDERPDHNQDTVVLPEDFGSAPADVRLSEVLGAR